MSMYSNQKYNRFVGKFSDLAELQSHRPIGEDGEWAIILDINKEYYWDILSRNWIVGNGSQLATEETLEKLLDNSNYRHKLTDDSSSPEYYMFLSNDYNYDLDTGDWKLLKMTDEETFYCFGSDNYETNWTNRASLTYN